MFDAEDPTIYLPQYLTELDQKKLLRQIDQYTRNPGPLYSNGFQEPGLIYQGDGIDELLVVSLPSLETVNKASLILSNSCDINPTNPRFIPQNLVYAPLVDFEKLSNFLLETFPDREAGVRDHLRELQKQYVTNAFYLPVGTSNKLDQPKVAYFDHVISLPPSELQHDDVEGKRLFSLSDLGFYLFVFKLSIHFTRVREDVARG